MAVFNGTPTLAGHVLSEYGNQTSFALPYNLYADQLLGTKLVPASVYNVAVQFISKSDCKTDVRCIKHMLIVVILVVGPFGVTLDSRQPGLAKSGT